MPEAARHQEEDAMKRRWIRSVLGVTVTAMVACGGTETPVKDPPPSVDTPHNTSGADRMPGGPGAMVTATATATTPPPAMTAPPPTATAPAMSAKPGATASSTTSSMSPPGGAGGPCDKCVGTVGNDLQTSLTKRAQDSRSCYVKVLTNNPTAKAAMNIELKVGRDGSACESQAHEEDPKWPGLADCVLGEFKKGGFPNPGGGACVVARVPILFAPAK
jgi:hypothetical protein